MNISLAKANTVAVVPAVKGRSNEKTASSKAIQRMVKPTGKASEFVEQPVINSVIPATP